MLKLIEGIVIGSFAMASCIGWTSMGANGGEEEEKVLTCEERVHKSIDVCLYG